MNKKTISILSVTVVFLLFAFYCLWKISAPEAEIYDCVHPEKQNIVRTSRIHGYIDSNKKVSVFPHTAGMLTHIYVKNGDNVRKGQTLATIDVPPQMNVEEEYAAREQNARLNLEQAERDERRAKDLLEKGAISTREYENAKNVLIIAKRELSLASSRIATNSKTTVITAPADGVVCDMQFVEGGSVSMQIPICNILNPDAMRFVGRADEIDVSHLKEGMGMTIIPGVDEKVRIPARLSYISEKGENINGITTFEIHADILDESIFHLRIGYSANAEVELERKDNVLAIEESFVYYDPEPFVYVLSSNAEDVKHQIWEKQYIKTGLSDGIHIEISGNITKETIIKGRKK